MDKRYDQFTAGTPDPNKIFLQAHAITGELEKIFIQIPKTYVAGTGITIDTTDPLNPIINATGGSTPDLQAVTDIGNTTTNDIIVTAANSVIAVANGGNNAALHSDSTRGGYIQFTQGVGNDAQIFAENLDTTREFQLPNFGGIIPISVNGNFADDVGNIDVISQLSNNAIEQVSDGIFAPALFPDQRSYGGLVSWVSGYNYHITAAGYNLNGAPYTSPPADYTLAAADPTFDRIDAFILNTSGSSQVLTGTPSANPIPPGVTLGSQLLLSFVLVQAGSTSPTLHQECIYLENTEWTSSVSNAAFNAASLVSPCQGTTSIEATNPPDSATVTLVRPAGVFDPRTDNTTLSFFLKSKGAWGKNRKIGLRWFNGATALGTEVIIKNGGLFDSSDTTTCQVMSIDLASFGLPAGATVDRIKIRAIKPSGSYGFFIDKMCLQGVIISPPPPPSSIADRFGIEDVLGVQNRSVDMQGFNLNLRKSGYAIISTGDDTYVGVEAELGVYSGNIVIQAQNDATHISTITAFPGSAALYTLDGSNTATVRTEVNGNIKLIADGIGVITFTQLSNTFTLPTTPVTTPNIIPVSVNGNFADSAGNIVVSVGGGSTRFGFSGEDDTAGENRLFDTTAAYGFKVTTANSATGITFESTASGPAAYLTGTVLGGSMNTASNNGIPLQLSNRYIGAATKQIGLLLQRTGGLTSDFNTGISIRADIDNDAGGLVNAGEINFQWGNSAAAGNETGSFDIRLAKNGATPNSVFYVEGNGDIYLNGYASGTRDDGAPVGGTTKVLYMSGTGLKMGVLPAGASVSDADATTKGILKLTNELGGTAALPTINNAAVIAKLLTAFASSSGSITSADSILSAIQKLDGRVANNSTTINLIQTGNNLFNYYNFY